MRDRKRRIARGVSHSLSCRGEGGVPSVLSREGYPRLVLAGVPPGRDLQQNFGQN